MRHEASSEGLATVRPAGRGPLRDATTPTRRTRTCRSSRCSTVVNERPRARGQGADRLRPRLPRGHLRLVRRDDQRHAARAAAQTTDDLPAPPAEVLRRRHDRGRAVAVDGVPGDPRPGRRPQRVRPDRPGRRLHHASTPASAADGNAIPVAKDDAGPRDRRRDLHRLRRVRGGVPERRRPALHGGEGRRTWTCCRRASRSAWSRSRRWSTRWRRLRELHELRRVRGGVPEGHQHRLHRADEPRLPEVEVPRQARGLRGGVRLGDPARERSWATSTSS